MFGLKKKNAMQIQKKINEIYQNLTITDYPESCYITQAALHDLVQNKEDAPVVAIKLANSLIQGPDWHSKLPKAVQPLLLELQQLGQKQLQPNEMDLAVM